MSDLKAAVAETKGAGYAAPTLKLIYAGKPLSWSLNKQTSRPLFFEFIFGQWIMDNEFLSFCTVVSKVVMP